MPQTVVLIQVRMPPALHEKLASLAQDNRESLNTVVVRLLTAAAEALEEKLSAIPALNADG
jgi:hypothetical protein